MICTAISKSGVGSTITIRTRPLTSKPPIDSFAKAICDPALTVEVIATTRKYEAQSQEAMLDKLLLVLFDLGKLLLGNKIRQRQYKRQ